MIGAIGGKQHGGTKNTLLLVEEGCQEINRRYLLSRFGHYHRLGKLNGRVRYGNGCDLSDMVTGRGTAGG